MALNDTNLKAYWDMDEASGTRVDSQNADDLGDNNTVTSTTRNQAADFELSNSEYLNITDASQSGLDLNSDFTLRIKAKFESKDIFQGLLVKEDTSSNRSFLFYIDSNNAMKAFFWDSGGSNSNATTANNTITTGVWYELMVVVDIDTPTITFYKDGSSVANASESYTGSGSIKNGSADFSIGARDNSGGYDIFMDGQMEEAAVWARALSGAEASSVFDKKYTDLTDGEKTSLVSYWPLKEANGTRYDAHGSNDLTDNNTVTRGNGDISLGTVSEYVEANTEWLQINSPASINLGADSDFSIICWARETAASNGWILSKNKGATALTEYSLKFVSDNVTFYVGDESSLSNTSTTEGAPDGAWVMIYAYHDSAANEIGVSINDQTVHTTAHTGGTTNDAGLLRIGRSANAGQYLDGEVGPTGIWVDKVLSAAEVTEIYNYGYGQTYDELSTGSATALQDIIGAGFIAFPR